MGWFGPSKDEVWRQLSQEMGAEFIDGGFWKGSKVQVHVKPWTITLDTYSESTRRIVCYLYPDACPVRQPRGLPIYDLPEGHIQRSGKLLGMQDIEVGDPDFDEAFIIKGNDESKVVSLFSDTRIRQMIQDQPKIRLDVKDSEGWFGPRFPKTWTRCVSRLRG